MSTPKADVVIVAAGASSRMSGHDKITAPIGGRPLLDWTVDRFALLSQIEQIVVVAPSDRVAEFRVASWMPARAVVVAGGGRRQESVAAGVSELERGGTDPDGVVLIHDGARPAVEPTLIAAVIDEAAAHGAAIPVLPVVETVKRVESGLVAETVDRTGLGFAQTPQGVKLRVLQDAYGHFPPSGPATFTDEAALLEACTIPVRVVPGHVDNIKVTVPADLERAASILGSGPRVGYGEDSHPFGPGEPLALGGIEITGAPRLHGHSDGDVVLHAVAGALLGAAGLPDLGRLFPTDARTPAGIASVELMSEVTSRVRRAGFSPTLVDVTIVGSRPRLDARVDEIRARLADLIGIAVDQVNVKASTGNLFGMEGAGRGISARAIATLEPARS
jgi:2-C-methyl-D-erythritol 4-phosphate cytidylyltransferase / 2-C-methyl-D-erythritol 2,4-cyclodiphosphate synthase